ncbi:hypothetical protein B0T22DRAFT_507444 [Podospora appendiculata]|uniref:Uncharacterized protein n=1 Tax=Podospora appendiculata TaxID=314037 RepID=A0AAE1CHD3_9PEZI|nr:hypothetical protein B0T22DRAFT_507444 [Podospora appendiculata]
MMMQPSASPLLFSLLLTGLAAAAPTDADRCRPRTICVDAINACGVKYGGCYNICDPQAKPIAPLCIKPSSTTTTSSPSTTPTPTDCEPRTICVDSVNACGVRYGGCYDICDESAKPVAPLCAVEPDASSTTSTIIVMTTATVPVPTSVAPPATTSDTSCPGAGSGMMVCADWINSCGMMYGGCFKDCKPWPTFVAPPCPSTTTSKTLTPLAPAPTLL